MDDSLEDRCVEHMLLTIGTGESNLVSDIRSSLAYVPVHLAHNSNMFVTVEKRIFLLSLDAHVTSACVGGFVGFETGMRQNNNQAPRVSVGRRYGDMLLCDELRELGRR